MILICSTSLNQRMHFVNSDILYKDKTEFCRLTSICRFAGRKFVLFTIIRYEKLEKVLKTAFSYSNQPKTIYRHMCRGNGEKHLSGGYPMGVNNDIRRAPAIRDRGTEADLEDSFICR